MKNREPSIHITKTILITLLDKITENGVIFNPDSNILANTLLDIAKKYSINTRVLILGRKKARDKVVKVVEGNKPNALLFQKYLILIRQKLKHRGIQEVKPGSKDWTVLLEVTALADKFTSEFGLTPKEGYVKFTDIGMSKMNKYSLMKFLALYPAIVGHYEALLLLSKDKTPAITKDIHKYYTNKIIEKTGLTSNYEHNPEKYLYFVKVKEEALKVGVAWKIWVEAQFASFEWREGLPDPFQLVGEKALQRVNKYLYEKNIKITHTSGKNLQILKNLGDDKDNV